MRNRRRWFSITSKDCKWQFYRGSGKGGQHRNKTDSAARCIHEPSGAVGTCEEYKEQKMNKKFAFKRMADSPEFKSWINLKIQAGLGNVEIDEPDDKGGRRVRKLSLNEV